MKLLLTFAVILSSLFLNGQNTFFTGTQTWTIASETVRCQNSDNQCLLVKYPGNKEFEILNEPIEGFNFENGYDYVITVRQEVKSPPIQINESVFRYILVKVISKKNRHGQIVTKSTEEEKIIEVNYETLPCESDNSKTCLLIKEALAKEFEVLDGTIFGFDYKPGYNYVISVKVAPGSNYYFQKEISKKFVKTTSALYNPIENGSSVYSTNKANETGKVIQPTYIQTSSPLDGKWYLRKFIEKEGSSFVTDDNIMWLEINTFNDKIKGFGACNTFQAVVKSDLQTTFQISKLTSGYINCGNKIIEDIFYSLLEQTDRFEIKNGNLILSKQWKYLMEFVSNPDKMDVTANSVSYSAPSEVKSSVLKSSSSYTTSDKSQASNLVGKDKEMEDMERQIQQLKDALEAKKKAESESSKEMEAQRIQREKELQAKLMLEEQEKQRIAQEKLKKQKEIDDLKKLLAEKEKEVGSIGYNTSNSSSTLQNYKIVNTNSNNTLSLPYRAGYFQGDQLVNFKIEDAVSQSDSKSNYYVLNTPKSTLRFTKSNKPRFFIELKDGSEPIDVFILSYTNDNKVERNFLVNGVSKNSKITQISYGYKVLKPGLFEIVFAGALEAGEYSFIYTSNKNIKNIVSSKYEIYCFGID